MLLAALQGVDKFYGEQVVLDGVTLELRDASRVALIGRNGAGKSTILRLLMGLEAPDGGAVFRREGVTVAMLEQDPEIPPGVSVLELAERAFADLDALEGRLAALEAEGLDDPEVYARWEGVHEVFARRGGYERRARRDAVLYALGFRGREAEVAAHLSGGEKTRLGLARLLMAQPDVLLLDEPTNHLDMEMRAWLESYLGRYPGAVVLVSHDRAFLDAASTSTAEIALGTLRTLDAIPSRYRAARAEQARIEAATRANQHKEHARLEAAATQMKRWAGQSEKLHRRAKAMERRAERYAAEMLPDADPEGRTVRFAFPSEPSGEIVLQAQSLSKAFQGKTLFEGVGFTLRYGERVALVGPNGAGKSTLLKLLLGELESDDPRALLRFGARVRVGYYDQELRGADPEATLLDEVIKLVGDREAHNLLGRFLFPYEAQFKRVADLSGGERARLALLKLTLGAYNFLVLDEPTNHLDLEMIEALEAALAAFEGTLLVVSHDRRFVAATTNLVWEVREGRFTAFEGDWDFYTRKRQERAAPQAAAAPEAKAPAPPKQSGAKTPSKWQLERDLEALEARVGELEAELAELAGRLEHPEGLSPEALVELGTRHAEAEAALLAAMAAWEETAELLRVKA
ncbi:ribosomal protection-like ABC-F family protein [Truepera radiovictrix]|uniref:ABC transporter related protein n=1 Tax=Truepera radiovictrix (strain DSM 17093 / CIP 108686 / LMG 22925 / RQ-24) TaxID=649638 RepID=D7CQB3_TRURR|nr:ABC-F family ATP-binding cassette domain-containing protein [Truepera radiovictrix]ADI14897.1 ABC transporter related protein [Truepera radiovictrix DSM 17093]WMT56551.1 ABC-F family ATP-binding cassette domain-containing protein [Truepera radiovictrix]